MESKRLLIVVLVTSIIFIGVTGATLILGIDTPTTDDGDSTPSWFSRDLDLLPNDTTIPEWEFEMLDRDNATMSQYRGKFVLMIFFATWCPSCGHQNIETLELYNSTSRAEIEFIQLTTAQGDSPQMLRDYITDHELEWDMGYATGSVGEAADKFLQLRIIPFLVVIDDLGRLRWIHEGIWRFDDFNATLSELMG